MRLDVFFTPEELTGADIRNHVAVVIDVLRATSTIVQAIASGARAIYPAGSMEEAVRLGTNMDRGERLLCGERRGMRIEGFDLGNSPLEFTPEAVGDRTLVMATTNGTPALVAASSAQRTLAASFLNLQAVVDAVKDEAAVALVCAGRERRFALEDAVCAGMLVERLGNGGSGPDELNDGAAAAVALGERYSDRLESMLAKTAAGQQLADIGHAEDVEYCATLDHLAVVPRLEDRRITA